MTPIWRKIQADPIPNLVSKYNAPVGLEVVLRHILVRDCHATVS